MLSYPQLNRAPIVEAVVDIQVIPAPGPAAFEAFAGWASAQFPVREEMHPHSLKIDAKSVQAPTVASVAGPIGHLFWTRDRGCAVQARSDGFAFNVLGKYRGWTEHREEASQAWSKYAEHLHPKSVTRCALRYMNLIELSADQSISESLRTYVQFPDSIAKTLNQFFMRVVIPLGEGRHGIITQSLPPPDGDGRGRLIFDIDVFTERQFDPSSNDVWGEIDSLHGLVGKCFFESLRPKLLEQFR